MLSRMSGTRSVPMKLQEMTRYKRVESKQDANSFQEQEEKQQNDKRQSYKKFQIEKALQDVVDAETVSCVEDIRELLDDKKSEIANSDMTETKKVRSLEYLQNVQAMCNSKIRQLRYESDLQLQIEEAKADGNVEEIARLLSQYTHEKNLRKIEEYTKLHANIKCAHKKVQIYSASQNAVDISTQVNGTGNYINVISTKI